MFFWHTNLGLGLLACAVGGSLNARADNDTLTVFDGQNLSAWQSLDGSDARWEVRDGYVEVTPGTGDIRTQQTFGDFELHLEFWIPYQPSKTGQERGNSGVYLQGRYEVQVLDSYQNDTYANGACGALYGQIAPSTNASLPPETWQTYDITFRAPKFGADGKVADAGHLTIVQNGVTIIDDGRFTEATAGALDTQLDAPGPLRLQDHGNKVRFRNIRIKAL